MTETHLGYETSTAAATSQPCRRANRAQFVRNRSRGHAVLLRRVRRGAHSSHNRSRARVTGFALPVLVEEFLSPFRQIATATRFRHGVTVEVGRPIAGVRVLGAEMPRAGLSARQTNAPSRRSASPIAEARSPKAAPSDSTSRSLQTPAPGSFSLARSAKPLRSRASKPGIAPRSPSVDSFFAHTTRICGHGRPWNTPHLSRTPARRRGSHTDRCYAAASRARGRRERTHPSCRVDRPGT